MESEFLKNLRLTTRGFFRRIGVQLVTIYVALIAVSGTAFTYNVVKTQSAELTEATIHQATDKSRALAVAIQSLLVANQQPRIKELAMRFDNDPEMISMQLFLGPHQKLFLQHNFNNADNRTRSKALYRLDNPIPSVKKQLIQVNETGQFVDIWEPFAEYREKGLLHLRFSLEPVEEAKMNLWRNFIRNGYLLILVAIVILILGVRRSVVALESYKNFASGLDNIEGQQVEVYRASTELAQLGDALNKTSIRLQEQNDLHKNTMVVMERLAAFSENSPNILLSFDKTGQLQYINPRGQQVMLEMDLDDHNRLLPPNYQEMIESSLSQQINIEDLEVHLGSRVFVWTFSPVPGQPLTHAFAMEITRRREAEKIAHNAQIDKMRAEAANEAKSRFLANVSHELRTPLNAIIGYSEMLEEDARDEGDKVASADANRIQVAAKHLLHLINEILDLSKIEAGKMDIYYEPFDVFQVIEDISNTIQPAMRKNRNQLSIDCDDKIGFMICDMIKLRQMLFNLLSNAAKFTSDGKIDLKVQREDVDGHDWLVFKVCDTGIGIEPAKQQKLFDAFVQADNSTTRKYGGSGLGLAISRKFCEMLGGQLVLESSPGAGSTFTVRLPAEPAPLPGMEIEQPPEIEIDPRAQRLTTTEVEHREKLGRILVIDDDPTFRDSMVRYFQSEGFRVFTASNGQEGLLLASEQLPDLITLDILMPGRNGWSILLALKKNPKLKSIPVIMVSSAGDKHIGLRMGADEYLSKPVNWEQLDSVVKNFFRKSEVG